MGGDKAYDMADFVAECRNLKVTPPVAQNLELTRWERDSMRARHSMQGTPSVRERGSAWKSVSDG